MALKGILISILTSSSSIVYQWGYIGIFLVSLFEAGTVIFPIAGIPLIFTFGGILNPFLVAIFAAIGGTIGSLTSYIIGAGGKELIEKKYGSRLEVLNEKFDKKGLMWIVTVLLIPLIPDNIMYVFLGVIRYEIKKYLLIVFLCKVFFNLIIAYSGYYSITWVIKILGTTT
jgi:uncharacterized membrane protein YdjX (TVP38/TMEM64 family)